MMDDAKRRLQKVRALDIRIQLLTNQRDELRERFGIKATQYDKDRVQTSMKSDTWQNEIEKLADIDVALSKLIRRYISLKSIIIHEIMKVEDARYIDLLQKKYIEYKSFPVIAEEMGYSEDWCKHLHGYALEAYRKANSTPKNTDF